MKRTTFVIQILSDNRGFVDYIPQNFRSKYDDKREANKTLVALQIMTKGNGFNYRVAQVPA